MFSVHFNTCDCDATAELHMRGVMVWRHLSINSDVCSNEKMDSEVRRVGRLMDIVDEDWQTVMNVVYIISAMSV